MSDQYWYLLDGKEHGPFSRAAIESLLQSAQLGGAFLGSTPEQAWQAPEELGLGANPPLNGSSQAISDPAVLVFRAEREIKRNSSLSKYVVGFLGIAAITATGFWLTLKSQEQMQASPVSSSIGTSVSHPPPNELGEQVQISDEVMAAQNAADAAAAAGDCAAENDAACQYGPLESPSTRQSTADVCSEMVDEILGPEPSDQVCSNIWQSYALRIRHRCKEIGQLGKRDPNDGSVASHASRQAAENKLDDAYQYAGEYQLRLPRHCR